MTGIERLNSMIEGQNDAALLQVVNYLKTRKDLETRFLNDEKDLKGMVSYIQEKARLHAKNGWNFVNDKVVYAWAVTYFLLPNSSLGIKPTNTKKDNKKQSNDTNSERKDNKIIPINTVKDKKEPTEQLSLFGGEL